MVLGGLLAVVSVVVTSPGDAADVRPQSQSFVATEVLVLQPGAQPIEPNLKKIAFLTTVGEVPRRAAKELVYDGPPAVLAAKIAVVVEADVSAIRISASDPDGSRAALLAATFAKHLLLSIEDAERARLEQARKDAFSQIEQISAAIADIDRRSGLNPDASARTAKDVYQRQLLAATERAQQLSFPTPPRSGFVTLEQATPIPTNAGGGGFAPPKSRAGRMVIVGLLGTFVAAGVALVLDRLDPRVQSREGAEAAFGLPVLAEVPALRPAQRRTPQVTAATEPGSTVAHAYRMLRTAVLLIPLPEVVRGRSVAPSNGAGPHDGGSPKVVLMTSADPAEGTTTAVANLAASFAESGRSVLVISCNLVSPRIHLYLGADEGVGVTDVLTAGGTTLDLRDVVQSTTVPGVSLVPAGTPRLRTSLALVGGLLAEARQMADIVLIDTGSLFGSSEAGELVGLADSVLLVAHTGRTNTDSAVRAGELLARFGAPAAGVVLLGARGAPGGAVRRPGAAAPAPSEELVVPSSPVVAEEAPERKPTERKPAVRKAAVRKAAVRKGRPRGRTKPASSANVPAEATTMPVGEEASPPQEPSPHLSEP